MRHGGNVMAPDAELAVHYARELFGRRNESVRLWVVRRADIDVLEDPDLLDPPLDRSFKKPGGYVMRDKLAAARARPGPEAAGASGGHDHDGRRTEGARWAAGAAPATRTAATLDPATRDALAELLLTMADDEFVGGFTDSEWTGIAPAPGGGHRDELDLAGRAGPRASAVRAARRRRSPTAATRTRSPTAANPPSTGTRASSTMPAAIGPTRSRGDSCTRPPTRRGWRRSVRASGRSPTSWPSSGARSATTGCTSSPGSIGWPAAAPSHGTASKPPCWARPRCANGLHAAGRRGGPPRGGILDTLAGHAEAAWRADLTGILVPLGLALPPRVEPPPPAGGSLRGVPLAVGRVHARPPLRGGRDVVIAATPGAPRPDGGPRRAARRARPGDPGGLDRRAGDGRRGRGRRPACAWSCCRRSSAAPRSR